MPRKQKSKISERAEKQRVYRKIKYAEIKQDPVLYDLEREKERKRYQERKKKKQIKSIEEESPRDQRERRKKWREASRKYRQKKKDDKMRPMPVTPELLLVDKPTSSKEQAEHQAGIPITSDVDDPLGFSESHSLVNLKIRKIRYIEQKKRKHLMRIIQNLQKENKMLRKKLQKQDEAKNHPKNVDMKFKKTSHKKAQEKKKEDSNLMKLIKKVREFYQDDLNSTLAAGKKQYVTKLKVQKQKRYMTCTQKALHKKFMAKYNVTVSYSFFCKHKPFWVLKPKDTQRETCLCMVHENVNLKVQALKTHSILDETGSEDLITSLCCSKYDEKCLKRECESCRSNSLQVKEFSNDQEITYYKWTRTRESIKTKHGQKIVTTTKKEAVLAKPSEVINDLHESIPKFLEHCYAIHNQYCNMKLLKDSLTVNCAVIHADFSENYGLKFKNEVQSMHYGGNRKEVCLHTAVIYNFDFHISATKPTSICTASSCLRHDSPAVWAHIIPLIERALIDNPFIDTLHFQTDSPVTQYRNKYIFYMIPQLHHEFPQVTTITWNYSEAGHGKGAPDGVGATIKRTVDSCVNHGEDVGTYDKFLRLVKENVKNVVVVDVPEENIAKRESAMPKNLPTFRGTFDVHQVLWRKGVEHLTFRKLSCFECNCGVICTHGKHLGFLKMPHNHEASSVDDNQVVPLSVTKRQSSLLTDITNRFEDSDINVRSVTANPSKIRILSNKRLVVSKAENNNI